MMKALTLFVALGLLLLNHEASAQYEDDFLGERDLLTVGGGAGFVTFFGDLSEDNDLSKYTNIKAGYSLNLEHRFGSVFGAQIEGLIGSIAYNEISRDITKHRNFQSSLMSFSAKAVFHFDNDIIIHRKSPFSPYIAFGVGYTTFDAYGDLQDNNGNLYHYWTDGTIRDIDENDVAAPAANIIYRDYEYETQLQDSITNYSRGSLTFPLTFGIKLKISPRIQGRIFATYNLTQSDWMDNVSENDNNDKFLYTGFTLHYVIRKKDPDAPSYKDVDFGALKSGDADGDGVRDTDDFCQGTPSGVKVSANGCPLDSDNDGVADYMDDEKESASGVLVDEHGVTISDEQLAARYEDYKDSLVTERVAIFSEDPSLKTLGQIENQIQNRTNGTGPKTNVVIPEALKEADIDTNGFISAEEISLAIDGFFEGTNDFSVKSLHDLIDFFFEQ
ncbi:MAG: hypothetical protein JKY54_17020 [Flavobacteriales bacterium]|nr:hypothetical protein [Flavobacteriales bacterium]